MPVEAHINTTFAMKWLVIGSLLVGFGCWCIYDGTVAYPASNERHEIYQEYAELDDLAGWVEHAQREGWSEDTPDHYSDMDILTQWIMLGIAWPLGFGALGMVLWFRGRTLVATEDAFISHRGERVPYDTITEIDKQRWDSKGIAYVRCERDGESRWIKIDDFVFRDAWRVLDVIEEQTGLGESVPG